MRRIQGTATVTIAWRTVSGVDEMNMPVYTERSVEIPHCLIADGVQSNSPASTMPSAVNVERTLYVPRSWQWESLQGATVTVGDNRYVVLGAPEPVSVGNMVTAYHPVGVQLARMED